MDSNSPNLPKQPVDFTWMPDAKITLTPKEFTLLSQPIEMFEWAVSVLNQIKMKSISEGTRVPIYMEDIDPNTMGLKDEKAFYERYANKETPQPVNGVVKPITKFVDTSGAPLN